MRITCVFRLCAYTFPQPCLNYFLFFIFPAFSLFLTNEKPEKNKNNKPKKIDSKNCAPVFRFTLCHLPKN